MYNVFSHALGGVVFFLIIYSCLGGEPSCSDMVMFSEQYLAAVDPQSSDCLPMSGEDTGLEALASPQAGYLGKVSEAHASSHCCHMRKDESHLEQNTVTLQYHSKFQTYTMEIFDSKRRKYNYDMS